MNLEWLRDRWNGVSVRRRDGFKRGLGCGLGARGCWRWHTQGGVCSDGSLELCGRFCRRSLGRGGARNSNSTRTRLFAQRWISALLTWFAGGCAQWNLRGLSRFLGCRFNRRGAKAAEVFSSRVFSAFFAPLRLSWRCVLVVLRERGNLSGAGRGGFAGLFDLKLRSHLAACWRLEARHEAGPQVRRRRQRALNEVGQEIAHPRINSR